MCGCGCCLFRYTRVYDMEEPSDDVQFTLERIARRLHARVPGACGHTYTCTCRTVYSQYICIYSSLVYAPCAVLSFTAFCHDHSCIHMRTHTHARTHTHTTHACAEGGGWDLLRAAQHFLIAFRSGRLGRVTLDSLPMPPPQQHSD